MSSERLAKWFFAVTTAAFLAAVGVIGLYLWVFGDKLAAGQIAWGEFGDYVGGILNPFFGYLALIGLLLTILIQSRELHLSTTELRNSVKALTKQNDSIERQNFESTFFWLIRLQADIADTLEIRDENHRVTQTGRGCFRDHYESGFVAAFDELDESSMGSQIEAIQTAYERSYQSRQAVLGHYFRHLYHLILFAKENAPADPYLYVRLARAQLSSYELAVLFYNCLTPVGANFKPLVEEFSLLHNMDESLLVRPEHHQLYDERAFGGARGKPA